jgi:hypothetical protein
MDDVRDLREDSVINRCSAPTARSSSILHAKMQMPSFLVDDNIHCCSERCRNCHASTFWSRLDPTAQHLPLVQTCTCLYSSVGISLVTVAEVHPCHGFPARNSGPIELDTAGQVRQVQQVRKWEAEDERPEVESHKMLTVFIQLETVEREDSLIRSCCPTSSPMQGLETAVPNSNDTVVVRRIPRKRRFPGSSDDDVAHARKRRRCN